LLKSHSTTTYWFLLM